MSYDRNFEKALSRFVANVSDDGRFEALAAALRAYEGSSESEEEARRVVAAWLSTRTVKVLDEKGVALLDQWDPMPKALLSGMRSPRYIDHPYMRLEPGGILRYVSEPYSLGSESIVRLAAVVKQGWSVHINALNSLHFPADTIYIQFTPPEGGIEEAGDDDFSDLDEEEL